MNRKVKIVVLDGYCVNSGDLNWDVLSTLGEMVVYDNTPYDLITERAKDADIIITNKCNIDSKVIDNLPVLKYVGELATATISTLSMREKRCCCYKCSSI